MLCNNKHCLARNAIHVDASTGFEVVKVSKPTFRNEVDDSMLLRHLHSDRGIIGSFGREIDINSFPDKGGSGAVWSIRLLACTYGWKSEQQSRA